MQGADHHADHDEPVQQLLLLERCLGLVDRDRTRATGVVAPPAPPYLLLSHGEEFEERVRLASEAAARFDLYVELLCLEAVDRVVVEYFDVSVGWVQQQQQQLEQYEQFEQQQQLERLLLTEPRQQLVQRQRKKLKVYENWEESLWLLEYIIRDRSSRCRVCASWARRCVGRNRCVVCRG